MRKEASTVKDLVPLFSLIKVDSQTVNELLERMRVLCSITWPLIHDMALEEIKAYSM